MKPEFLEIPCLLAILLDISPFNLLLLLLLNNYLNYLTLILNYFDRHHLFHLQDLILPSILLPHLLLLLFYINPPLHHIHYLPLLHPIVLILKLLFLPLLIPFYHSIPFHFTSQSHSWNPHHLYNYSSTKFYLISNWK